MCLKHPQHHRERSSGSVAGSPFIRDNLAETVHHACVVILARHRHSALDLNARLDYVEGVHDQDLGDTSHGASSKLVDEGEGFVGRHIGDRVGVESL